VTSKAQSAYIHYANQLKLGGIYNLQRFLRIEDFDISFILQKDFTYGFITGFINITHISILDKDEKVCEIYLESGYYDLIGVGRCTEDAYLPAILIYDPDTASYVSSIPKPLQGAVSISGNKLVGENIISGSVSKSLGCIEPLASFTDPCGNGYGNGGYCEDLWKLKDAQDKIPSSMFSGKLRLYIQSIYGSTRTDYERSGFTLVVGDQNDIGNLADYPVVEFTRGFVGSSWIYTTENYDYFLCTQYGNTVIFKPLELSVCAERYKKILIENPKWDFAQKTRVEAYILAYAKVTNKNKFTLTIQGDVINGSPLDYGWHTEWDGHTATVVCFYKDPLAPQYLSDQHQLTVVETWNGEFYTFTVNNTRLQSDMPWWPWTNQLHVFYYSEAEESMVPVEYPAPIFGGYEGTFDSPIYNYYILDKTSGESELVTVNMQMNVEGTPNLNYDISGDKRYDIGSHNYITKKSYSGPNGKKGFKVGGTTQEITEETLIVDETSEVTQLTGLTIDTVSGSLFGQTGNTIPISDAAQTTSKAYIESLGFSVGETREVDEKTQYLVFMMRRFRWEVVVTELDTTSTSGGALFVQTMLGNCSNVILGKKETTEVGGKTVRTKPTINKAYTGILYWSTQDPNSVLNPSIKEFHSEMPGPNYVNIRPTYDDNNPPVSDVVTNTPAVPEASTIQMFEFNNGGANEVVVEDDSQLEEYFTPTISDKPTHTIDTSRSSINNKFKISHASFDKDGGFINDSSIGWA